MTAIDRPAAGGSRGAAWGRGVATLVLWGPLLAACAWPASKIPGVGLYFEPVSFSAAALGGPLGPDDLAAIRAVALDELRRAFAGYRVAISDRRDARFTVGVVQDVRDLRVARRMSVAGASRAISGFGGSGTVNFALLAGAAVSCAPAGADRRTLLDAIGRGVGRAAAHEAAHQLLPTAPLHDSRDLESYEYHAASRCQQYFGPMHWDLAGPLLAARLGR
ncbi:MAG: hypothetical protein R2745_00855 [Vicinamibacterales bacterium]